MGPTSRAPLPAGTASGKAALQLADAERRDAPAWSNRCERLKDEASARELGMRDGQAACTKFAAAPQGDVEVEDARSPASSWPPSELTLERLQARKHRQWVKVALDQRDGVGKIATGATVSGVQHDR